MLPTVKVHRGRELTGAQRFSSICPVSNYEHMRLHRRILGHLSAVYCIAFDRTGLRIFTVSWSLSLFSELNTYFVRIIISVFLHERALRLHPLYMHC